MLVEQIFNTANNNNIGQRHRIPYIHDALLQKGFGDREQELEFISKFLKKVFNNYHQLESFSFTQYQDYNDNYLEFTLENFYVNVKYHIEVYGLHFSNIDEDWSYRFSCEENWERLIENNKKLSEEDWLNWERSEEELQKQLAPIKKATDCILVFLKALYDYYKPYYFIYVFGRRATVTITKQGIEINNNEINYIDGDSWDKSFIM